MESAQARQGSKPVGQPEPPLTAYHSSHKTGHLEGLNVHIGHKVVQRERELGVVETVLQEVLRMVRKVLLLVAAHSLIHSHNSHKTQSLAHSDDCNLGRPADRQLTPVLVVTQQGLVLVGSA